MSRTERPILFSGPMVRALLAGMKTQTRRVVKPGRSQPWLTPEVLNLSPSAEFVPNLGVFKHPAGGPLTCVTPPYGVRGDVLWVRETWCPADTGTGAAYRADAPLGSDQRGMGWRPSIHMPRSACRLRLQITDLRIERLAAISEADAAAEGVFEPSLGDLFVVDHGNPGKLRREHAPALVLWEFLWRAINGDASWAANPWVWVISFEVLPSE